MAEDIKVQWSGKWSQEWRFSLVKFNSSLSCHARRICNTARKCGWCHWFPRLLSRLTTLKRMYRNFLCTFYRVQLCCQISGSFVLREGSGFLQLLSQREQYLDWYMTETLELLLIIKSGIAKARRISTSYLNLVEPVVLLCILEAWSWHPLCRCFFITWETQISMHFPQLV